MGQTRWWGAGAAGLLLFSCATVKPAPVATPLYKGNGQPVVVDEQANGQWKVRQGKATITAAQALELAEDPEYLTRRRETEAYNQEVEAVARSRAATSNSMLTAGLVTGGVSAVSWALVLFKVLYATTLTPATATTPEVRTVGPGPLHVPVLAIALAATAATVGLFGYAFWGQQEAPYTPWALPKALDNPEWVRLTAERKGIAGDAPVKDDRVPRAPPGFGSGGKGTKGGRR